MKTKKLEFFRIIAYNTIENKICWRFVMSFYLHSSGLFYYSNSVVKVSKKPEGVVRYTMYTEIEPPKIIVPWDQYDMRKGGLLEVLTDDLERHFFEYQRGMFVQRFFKKIDILEGEHELLKQLGLNGFERATHCDEYPIL